jgi:large subunit ribosomal protein L30
MATHIKVTRTRSTIGRTEKERETLKGLGLTYTGRVRILKDTPEIRGMILKVSHLVSIEPFDQEGK